MIFFGTIDHSSRLGARSHRSWLPHCTLASESPKARSASDSSVFFFPPLFPLSPEREEKNPAASPASAHRHAPLRSTAARNAAQLYATRWSGCLHIGLISVFDSFDVRFESVRIGSKPRALAKARSLQTAVFRSRSHGTSICAHAPSLATARKRARRRAERRARTARSRARCRRGAEGGGGQGSEFDERGDAVALLRAAHGAGGVRAAPVRLPRPGVDARAAHRADPGPSRRARQARRLERRERRPRLRLASGARRGEGRASSRPRL